jgi:hypothetical protein
MPKDSISKTKEKSNKITSKDGSICVSTENKTNLSDESKSTENTANYSEEPTDQTDDSDGEFEEPETQQEVLDKIKAVKPHITYCKTTGIPLKFYIADYKRNLRKLTFLKVNSKEEIKALGLKIVEIMNFCFTRTMVGSDTCIIKLKRQHKSTGLIMDIFSFEQFKKLFTNVNHITVGRKKNGNRILSDVATFWLEHYKANDAFDGMDLLPDLEPLSIQNNWFNTWQGFGVNDVEADESDPQIKKYLHHLKDVICDGNQEHYEEMLRFLAHFRQRPYEKPLYDIILESEEHGTGKSTFLRPLLTLAGSHGTEVQKSSSITGTFNSKLANKTFVVGEEAFAGSYGATNIIKNLITSPTFDLEFKHKDSTPVTNYLRLFLTTNQKDILKVDLTERRHFYLKVSAKRMLDKEYFDDLKFAWGNSKDHILFTSKLSYFLNNYPLDDDYLPKNPPVTKLLNEKKLDHLSQENFFVFMMLDTEVNGFEGTWSNIINNHDIERYYYHIKTTYKTKVPRKESSNPVISVAMILRKIGCKSEKVANRRAWKMPEKLDEAKKLFCASIKQDTHIFQKLD